MRKMSFNKRAIVLFPAVVTAIYLLFPGCTQSTEQINIEVSTTSGSEFVIAEMEVDDMEKSGRVLSISFTNTGSEVEYIKDIRIRILPEQDCNTESRFLYGGHDMGRTPMQQVGYNDEQFSSGTFVMIRHNEASFTKTGILTWHIFRPYITFLKDEGIIISAEGENKPVNRARPFPSKRS